MPTRKVARETKVSEDNRVRRERMVHDEHIIGPNVMVPDVITMQLIGRLQDVEDNAFHCVFVGGFEWIQLSKSLP
jgi:hypothetical protein